MGEIFEQIKLFHYLKLQPISKEEVKRWNRKVENYLRIMNNINRECNVVIERMNKETNNKIEKRRGLRLRQKKKCCC